MYWFSSPRQAKIPMAMDKALDQRSFIWTIDGADKIVHVNDAWLAFAVENTAPQLTAASVLGQSIWRFIQGQETGYLYQQICGRVRGGKSPVTFPFRCDSPDCRRFMEMELALLPGAAIQFTAHILREEWRDPIDLLDASRNRSKEFVTVCSWCKRIHIPGRGWGEVEAAIRALDLFGHQTRPRMTHTICDSCRRDLTLELHEAAGEKPNPE
jgi:hypothetical protein